MPDLSYTLIVTKKELVGNDASLAAVAPGENNTSLAQFAGLIPRARARDIDLLDEITVEITFKRAVTEPVAETQTELPLS